MGKLSAPLFLLVSASLLHTPYVLCEDLKLDASTVKNTQVNQDVSQLEKYYVARNKYIYTKNLREWMAYLHELDIIAQKLYVDPNNNESNEELKALRLKIKSLHDGIQKKNNEFENFAREYDKNLPYVSYDLSSSRNFYNELQSIEAFNNELIEMAKNKEGRFTTFLGINVINRTILFLEMSNFELNSIIFSLNNLDQGKASRIKAIISNNLDTIKLLKFSSAKLMKFLGETSNLSNDKSLNKLNDDLENSKIEINKVRNADILETNPSLVKATNKLIENEFNIFKLNEAFFKELQSINSIQSLQSWYVEYMNHLNKYWKNRKELGSELNILMGGDDATQVLEQAQEQMKVSKPLPTKTNSTEDLERFFSQ